ncbi:restriction endonuclease subunit S [Xanthomonas campestris pv. incanae]|nr:restriction endonuclease subunit S [Xanthomonas campestris]WDJ85901.1 restriction endonuclease subunit S [Xanthomonas campestris pv. incanae]WDK25000.1 restriction endonuclease subunit S [Xanthomonas campestris pv. incanae]
MFSDGDWIESKDQSTSGIRLLQTGNVGGGEFKDRAEKARFISAGTFARLNCTEVLAGDILISRLPDPVGRACIVPELDTRMITAVDCSIVRLDEQLILPKLFVYFTQTDAYLSEVAALCTGTTRSRISRTALGQIEFPTPPMDEQKRIVAVLDQAFAALDRARANCEESLQAAEGLLRRALGDEFEAIASQSSSLALQDAVHPDCSLSYGIVQPGDEVSNGLPIVRPVDLTRREVGLAGLKRIDLRAARGYARTTLKGGELLLCVRGSTGAISVAEDELAGSNVTRGIVPIRFEPTRVLRDFAYFQFCFGAIRSQIAEKTYGAALMQINIKDLRNLRFVVPDIALQRDVIARSEALINSATALRTSYKAQIADIAALRQSLLQAAFSGQLT